MIFFLVLPSNNPSDHVIRTLFPLTRKVLLWYSESLGHPGLHTVTLFALKTIRIFCHALLFVHIFVADMAFLGLIALLVRCRIEWRITLHPSVGSIL
jgi:hypothetical protein